MQVVLSYFIRPGADNDDDFSIGVPNRFTVNHHFSSNAESRNTLVYLNAFQLLEREGIKNDHHPSMTGYCAALAALEG